MPSIPTPTASIFEGSKSMPSETATERPLRWGVADLNATAFKPGTNEIMPRVHDVAPGVRVELFSDRETFMDEKYARLFMKDEAFIVRNADGIIVKALTEAQLARVAPQEKLAPNLVIADLDELTDTALEDRAKLHPKAGDLPADADRALLIDFLLGVFKTGTTRRRGMDDAVGELTADLESGSPDEALRILEGA